MNFIKKIILVLLFLFPISNSFGAMVTFVQNKDVSDSEMVVAGIHFNPAGTKMFVVSSKKSNDYTDVYEYNLSTPFDISTASYATDAERCNLDSGSTSLGPNSFVYDLEFSNDGMKLFVGRGNNAASTDADRVFRFDLTSPYDVSTCSFVNQTSELDSSALQDDSNAGNVTRGSSNRLQGIEISDDGTKLFAIFHSTGGNTRLLEYQLSTAFDLSDISLVTNAGIELEDETTNPKGIRFSPDGKRLWAVDHQDAATGKDVTQISLDVAFSTSSFTIDGTVSLSNNAQPNGIAFSTNGLKMYVGGDTTKLVIEYDLVCPFNIIAGKCPSITENSDRTGMAEAQIELAKRTIEHSTNSTLNRLKWIRRNKDKQYLTNLNINLNFSNQMLASFTEAVRTSAAKKKTKDKKQDVFYWSEGSIAVGRIGDTSISSTKKIGTGAITVGVDKFTSNNGIKGLAFRVGRNNVDVGTAGSNLDTDTYNITYYATSPVEDDTKFIDTIIGFGKLKSDLLTVLDGKNLTADRKGNQLYGTIKIKDEIKKNNLILIPSGQFDFGHTILHGYKETGTGAIEVEDQHVRTKKLRATMAIVEDLSNDKYEFKRHGKLEYVADIDRSSNFKYTYVSDSSTKFNDTLHTGALHNLNGEIGFDIIFPEHYSIFVIYERNHAFDSGYTDNIHIALGYLPHKDTEYAFSVDGLDNLMSQFEIKKNINGYDLSFNLNDDLTNLGNNKEASINLNKVF